MLKLVNYNLGTDLFFYKLGIDPLRYHPYDIRLCGSDMSNPLTNEYFNEWLSEERLVPSPAIIRDHNRSKTIIH